nr:ATP-binding protein [Rhodoferax sp.]
MPGDTVNAEPTKRLVVYVLTKDVLLDDAILDLIDNAIDGAKRQRGSKLTGKEVRVTLSKNSFEIEDNCGGIPYELARDHAFRFGRPEEYAPNDGPSEMIGNFGVGMKRALLKMGRTIKVVSRTAERYFEVTIDVGKWLRDPAWTFEFSNVQDRKSPAGKVGTSITVTDLYPGVSEQFGLQQFIVKLKSSIEAKQADQMLRGFSIVVNGEHLSGMQMVLGKSRLIGPFNQNVILTNARHEQVRLQVCAGIDEPNNDLAGWYVICNGRTVLRADRSNQTGWGNKFDSDRIPSYHHQYARFRGFVMFHSDVPDNLPWNTAKSGVDVEHPYYRRALQMMMLSMKEVFVFLNQLDRESDSLEQPLTEAVVKLKSVPLSKVSESRSFRVDVDPVPASEKTTLKLIRYKKPVSQVNAVMAALGVSDPSVAGEQTFDLYYEMNADR